MGVLLTGVIILTTDPSLDREKKKTEKTLFGRLNKDCELILVYKWIDPVTHQVVSKELHPALASKASLRQILVDLTDEIKRMNNLDLCEVIERKLSLLGRLEL